jgi:hypothetical protein
MARKPIPLRLTAAAATRAIRERAQDSANVVLTFHAQDRMQERDVSAAEVFRILREGQVFGDPVREAGGDWKAEIEKRLPGRRDAAVVTVIRAGGSLVVVTVMWRDLA